MITAFENVRLSFSVVFLINICFGQYVPYYNYRRPPYVYPYQYTYPSIQQKYYYPQYRQIVPTYYTSQNIPYSLYNNRYAVNNLGLQNAQGYQQVDNAAKFKLLQSIHQNTYKEPTFEEIYNVYKNKNVKDRISKNDVISKIGKFNSDDAYFDDTVIINSEKDENYKKDSFNFDVVYYDESVIVNRETDENYSYNEENLGDVEIIKPNDIKKKRYKKDHDIIEIFDRFQDKKVNELTNKKPNIYLLHKAVSKVKANEVVNLADSDKRYKKNKHIDIIRPKTSTSDEISDSDENNYTPNDSISDEINDSDQNNDENLNDKLDDRNETKNAHLENDIDSRLIDSMQSFTDFFINSTGNSTYIEDEAINDYLKNNLQVNASKTEMVNYILQKDSQNSRLKNLVNMIKDAETPIFYLYLLSRLYKIAQKKSPNLEDLLLQKDAIDFYEDIIQTKYKLNTVSTSKPDSKDVVSTNSNNDDAGTDKSFTTKKQSVRSVSPTEPTYIYADDPNIETSTPSVLRSGISYSDSDVARSGKEDRPEMISTEDIESNPFITEKTSNYWKSSTDGEQLSSLENNETTALLLEDYDGYYVTDSLDEEQVDSLENDSTSEETSVEYKDRLEFMNYLLTDKRYQSRANKYKPLTIKPISWDIKPETNTYAQVCFKIKTSEIRNLARQFFNENSNIYKSFSAVYDDDGQVLHKDKPNNDYEFYFDEAKGLKLPQQFEPTNPVINDDGQLYAINKEKVEEYDYYPLDMDLNKQEDIEQYQILNSKKPMMHDDDHESNKDQYKDQTYKLSNIIEPQSIAYYILNKDQDTITNPNYKEENFDSKNEKPELSKYPFFYAETPMWQQNVILNPIKQTTNDGIQWTPNENYQLKQQKNPQYIQQDAYSPDLNVQTFSKNYGIYPKTLNNLWDYLKYDKLKNTYEYNQGDDNYSNKYYSKIISEQDMKGIVEPTYFSEHLNQQLPAKQKDINDNLNKNNFNTKYTETHPLDAFNAEEYEYLKELSYLLQNQPNYKTYTEENIGKYNSDLNDDIIHKTDKTRDYHISYNLPYDQGLKKNHYTSLNEINRALPTDMPDSTMEFLQISTDLTNDFQEVTKENNEEASDMNDISYINDNDLKRKPCKNIHNSSSYYKCHEQHLTKLIENAGRSKKDSNSDEEYPKLQENNFFIDYDIKEDVNYTDKINQEKYDKIKENEYFLDIDIKEDVSYTDKINEEGYAKTQEKKYYLDFDEEDVNYSDKVNDFLTLTTESNQGLAKDLNKLNYINDELRLNDEYIAREGMPTENKERILISNINKEELSSAITSDKTVIADEKKSNSNEDVVNVHGEIDNSDEISEWHYKKADVIDEKVTYQINNNQLDKLEIIDTIPGGDLDIPSQKESVNVHNESIELSVEIESAEKISDWHQKTIDVIDDEVILETSKSSNDKLLINNKKEFINELQKSLDINNALRQPLNSTVVTDDTIISLNDESMKFFEIDEEAQLLNDSNSKNSNVINSTDEASSALESAKFDMFNDQNLNKSYSNILKTIQPQPNEPIVTDDKFINSADYIIGNDEKSKEIKSNEMQQVLANLNIMRESNLGLASTNDKISNTIDNQFVLSSNSKYLESDKLEHSEPTTTDNSFMVWLDNYLKEIYYTNITNSKNIESEEQINLNLNVARESRFDLVNSSDKIEYTGDDRSIISDNSYHSEGYPKQNEIIMTGNKIIQGKDDIIKLDEQSLTVYDMDKINNHSTDIKQSNINIYNDQQKEYFNEKTLLPQVIPEHKETIITDDRFINAQGALVDDLHKIVKVNGKLVESDEKTMTVYDANKTYLKNGIKESNRSIDDDQKQYYLNEESYSQVLPEHSEVLIKDDKFVNAHGAFEDDLHEIVKVNGEIVESSEERLAIYNAKITYDQHGANNTVRNRLINSHGTVTDVKHKEIELDSKVKEAGDDIFSELNAKNINNEKSTKTQSKTNVHQNKYNMNDKFKPRHSELLVTDDEFINSQGYLEEDIHETIKVNGETIESEEDILIHGSEEEYNEKGLIDFIENHRRVHKVSPDTNVTVISPQLRMFLAKFHDCFGFYPKSVSNSDIVGFYFDEDKLLGESPTTDASST